MERLGSQMDVSSHIDQERYYRQLILPEIGSKGQQDLERTRVAVLGAGGLGGPILYYLVAAGIGDILVIDHDIVDRSNLQRQILYTGDDLGALKAEVAVRRLERLNEHVRITPCCEYLSNLNADTILAPYDIIVDACDNFPSRYLLDSYCSSTQKPLVHGAIEAFCGQVSVFHSHGALGYRDLFPKMSNDKQISPPGVIGATAGVIGSIQASQVIQIAIGTKPSLAAKLLTINLLSGEWTTFDI